MTGLFPDETRMDGSEKASTSLTGTIWDSGTGYLFY
jgi:hypothetical protein